MRKLLLLMTTLFSLASNSQEIYESFLQDGKVWNYCNYDLMGEPRYTLTLFVQGDTIIDGNLWKKIYMNDSSHYQYALREDNHAVYIYDSYYKNVKIFDFNLNVGDDVMLADYEVSVDAIDTIMVGNNYFRRFYIKPEGATEPTDVWIQGIGGVSVLSLPIQLVGNNTFFVSCEQDGEMLITASDFYKPSIAGIGEVSSSSASVSPKVYSADGKELDGLTKGLNIVKSADGKTVKVIR